MNWNKEKVEMFLGCEGALEGKGIIYSLSFPGGPIDICIFPDEDRVQIYNRAFLSLGDPCDPKEALSAYIHCQSIEVDYSNGPDNGFLVLNSSGGGVCISKQEEYYALFFSMRNA